MLKGISPLVATVLLIAFTVAVGGIVSVWILGFSRTQTSLVGKEAKESIICSYASIALSDVSYCSTTSTLSGKIENTGSVVIGDIKLSIILTNGTILENPLCEAGGKVIKCSSANLTLGVREIASFNLSSSSNYDLIRVSTNCSTCYDEIESSDVTLSC